MPNTPHVDLDTEKSISKSLTPKEATVESIETIEYWLNAYSDPESGEHFLGHGMVVCLLAEYLSLRKSIAEKDNAVADSNTGC